MKVGAPGSLGLRKTILLVVSGRIGATCWPMPLVCCMVATKWKAGVRYILVCFVILKNFANFATRFYQAVRDEDPEEFEPLPPGIEGVDSA